MMNDIEVIICLVLLFMAVPDVCRKLGRPALTYAVFVLIGVTLRPLANAEVSAMLEAAGKVGFLLLLFEVGLEIDVPRWREFLRPLRFAVPWALVQYPVILGLGTQAGLDLVESLVAAAALTGCSVGMAFAGWKNYPGLADGERAFSLHVLITLETLAIVLLAAETAALKEGLQWTVLFRLAGVVAVVAVVGLSARHVTRLFQKILETTTHWRTHLLVLVVLAICALGERIGLAAAKTAFFLGLFMSRAEHDGKGLEEFVAPVSRRFLIPIFFVALGMKVEWQLFASWTALLALGTAGLVLGLRQMLHRRWLPLGGDPKSFLLLCPNLTVVALGSLALLEARPDSGTTAGWLLLTGLFLTLGSLFLLPRAVPGDGCSGDGDNSRHKPSSSDTPGAWKDARRHRSPTAKS